MEQKNRFSILLEHLMSTAELKNYTLAQKLQYDVSYISKWVSGRVIPSEKTEKKVLRGISHCIVTDASQEGKEHLLRDYELIDLAELEVAIYDHLEAEYNYVKDLEKNTGSTIAPKTFFFPELTLSQYIVKMHHPVLRRVNSLNIMAALDLLSIDREYRLQFVSYQNPISPDLHMFPNVHFSLVINLDVDTWDYIYDTIFLINMLTNNTHINFQLYGSPQASGKVISVVEHDFSISGMLVDGNRCMVVVVSEDEETSNVLYRNISKLCSREMLLFRQSNMSAMLTSREYVHTLLSPNPRWLLGHMTEHFLSDDLFEEIVNQLSESGEEVISVEELRNIHHLSKKMIEESSIQLMFYESAFSDLAVSGELDFYNHKVHLTANQRLRYLEHLLELFEHNKNLQLRLVYGRLVSDFQYIASQCVFLSDVISYLRLDNNNNRNNLVVINHADMERIFDRFYQEVWNNNNGVLVCEQSAIAAYIQHVMQGIVLISHME